MIRGAGLPAPSYYAETTERAWHFLRVVDGVPVLRDGKTSAPPIGEWLEHEGPIVACQSGLHASRRAIDALDYLGWEGGVVCLVEVDGVEAVETDKIVCRRRRIIATVPCDDVLRIFAREVALSVAHLWEMPPIVRQYLETGDEEIRAAAARAAARAAATDAAWAAAWAAARAAAWAAATAAATDAARAAAWAAARAAAWAAATDDQNALLESLLLGEMDL